MQVIGVSQVAWSGNSSKETIDVPPGLRVPMTVTASGPLSRIMGGSDMPAGNPSEPDVLIEARAIYDVKLGRYRIECLQLDAPHGVEISGTLLRRIPVQTILRWMIPRAIREYAGENSAAIMGYRFPERATSQAAGGAGRGPTAEDLVSVATVYRLAEIASDAPAKAVAEAFQLEKRTATNWILKARASGYLNHDGQAPDSN